MFQIVLATEFIETLKSSTRASAPGAVQSSITSAPEACPDGFSRSLGCYAHLALGAARRALGAH